MSSSNSAPSLGSAGQLPISRGLSRLELVKSHTRPTRASAAAASAAGILVVLHAIFFRPGDFDVQVELVDVGVCRA